MTLRPPSASLDRTRPHSTALDCTRWLSTVLVFLLPSLLGIALFYVLLRDIPKDALPSLTAVMRLITHHVKTLFYVIYALLFIHALLRRDKPRQRFCVRYLIAQLLFAALLVHLIKNGLGWARPLAENPDALPAFFNTAATPPPDGYRSLLWNTLCIPRSHHQSMPSGHTVDILISTLPLALLWSANGRGSGVRGQGSVSGLSQFFIFHFSFFICAASAALVIFSRLWLRAHHPHDTLAGIAIALLATLTIPKNAPKPVSFLQAGRRRRHGSS